MADMQKKIILLNAKGYNMKDEVTGKVNTGISIRYLLTDNLSPVYASSDEKGVGVAKVAVQTDEGKNIKSVPGIYNGGFSMKPKADGSVVFKLETLEFLSELELKSAAIK